MKVSDSRKIHIIALPHETWNAWRSEDQSAISPRQPLAAMAGSMGVAAIVAVSFMGCLLKMCRR
jgi:predicted transcriptional regulator